MVIVTNIVVDVKLKGSKRELWMSNHSRKAECHVSLG